MKKTILFLILLVFLLSPLAADTREDNIDLFLVVDKSLSMEEEIDAVKSYISDFLVSTFLIPGDDLLMINFYGLSDTVVKIHLDSDESKAQVLAVIDKIMADGRFTDIGNALDRLKNEVDLFHNSDRKKYLLLITDGIQEAPPESPYWSKDGSFNHLFLENTKTIRREGWKIQIIGLGSETAARQIAEELSGAYSEIDLGTPSESGSRTSSGTSDSDVLTADDIQKAAASFTGMIEVSEGPFFTIKDESGSGFMSLSIKASGYDEGQHVVIEGLYFTSDDYEKWNLIGTSKEDESTARFLDFSIPPDSSMDFKFPVTFPSLNEGETLSGEVFLVFSGSQVITPASFNMEAEIEEKFPLWIIISGALFLLLILLILLFIRARKSGTKNSIEKTFLDLECSIKGKRNISKNLILGREERIYILQAGFGLDFLKSRKTAIENALAFVSLKNERLIMETVQPDIFKTKAFLAGNILGKELEFILSGKDSISLKFMEKSTNGK